MSKLKDLFEEEAIMAISKIPTHLSGCSDRWIQTKTNSGKITVKSAYWLSISCFPPSNYDNLRGQVWKTKIHEWHKMLLWRISADCLPTKEKIGKFSELPDDMCLLCNSEKESALHIFTKCPLTKALWFGCQWGIRLDDFNFTNITDLLSFC